MSSEKKEESKSKNEILIVEADENGGSANNS